MGFRTGRRAVDNIFILRTTIDKYLLRKRDKVYWLFVHLQKTFDTVVREVLWWKLGKKGISRKFIEGVEGIYKNVNNRLINATVNVNEYEVLRRIFEYLY
jgi:hypothetical protein